MEGQLLLFHDCMPLFRQTCHFVHEVMEDGHKDQITEVGFGLIEVDVIDDGGAGKLHYRIL